MDRRPIQQAWDVSDVGCIVRLSGEADSSSSGAGDTSTAGEDDTLRAGADDTSRAGADDTLTLAELLMSIRPSIPQTDRILLLDVNEPSRVGEGGVSS